MKNALVTGGGGFIGGRLCGELVNAGYDVWSFGHTIGHVSDVEYAAGDIRDAAAVMDFVGRADVVFHLAGLLGTNSAEVAGANQFVEVNITGAVNVFDAARRHGTPVVHLGLVPNWTNAYMITKKTAARFGQMYSELYGTPIVTVEMTHVYGPGQPTRPYRKAIPTFITNALRGEPLTVFGTGDRLMDFIFVDDAASALRLAAETPEARGSVLEVSTGERLSVLDLAKKILEVTGSESEIEFGPMRLGEPADVDPDELSTDCPQAREALGWEPTVGLDEGLERTIDYYRSHT